MTTELKPFLWGNMRRFNAYAEYFRTLFGYRVQKVSIDAGFTCPNRDGSKGVGGCTFCNNSAFNPSYCSPQKSVAQQIEEGIEFHRKRYRRAKQFLVYFQAYSNTYTTLDTLKALYEPLIQRDDIAGIVIGTRPDCVDDEKLDYFAELAKRTYLMVEYGVESAFDDTLLRINRGHDVQTSEQAIRATASRGIATGAHFILGLPGENRERMLKTIDFINRLPLTTVKFHQLQIFKDTQMERDFTEHPEWFDLFTYDSYLTFLMELIQRLKPDVMVERFAGEVPPRYLAQPGFDHVRYDELLRELESRLETANIWQGKLYKPTN